MISRRQVLSLVLFAVAGGVQQGLIAADWPTFRGADRTAFSQEKDLLQEWPAGGPKLLWKADGSGRGYTSPAISNGRIFLLGDSIADVSDSDEYLICLDLKDGKRLWVNKAGSAWKNGQPTWQSSRSTPTVDVDRVYALTADGELFCCNVETGKEIWRKDLKKDFGGVKADIWGYSESVEIDGNQLVCTPGGEKATMVALDKLTGNTLWSVVREGDRGAGHASIVKTDIGGVRVYVQTTGGGALGVRATDGKLLWSYPMEKTTAIIPTPIVKDDLVFAVAGYKRGGALLQQIPDGNGGVDIKEIYPLKPELGNKHGGVVLVGDYIYGDSEDSGIPFCAELKTGKVQWRKRGTGSGSIAMAAADGRLYLHYANGTMALAKADPNDYEEVGAFTVPGSGERPSWSHPVILDGKLYLREQNCVLCFDIREKNTDAKSSGN
ncbi:PQQ-binding-like beta-propeller repeat protein [Schlesneria sp. DSM 10557]|uniref:PQQ-binding-like beta-propeller repeat protein n=1 Tax=Schlesneria sp. DSM 10557 TaxID=3044399 RepID=UPI00359FB53C